MSTDRANLTKIQIPLELLVQAARRLAQHEEYQLAETLLRWALAWDESDAPALRWLEFVLEAQNKFEEAYQVHIQTKSGRMTLRAN
ncbi:MAG: hypothetical protein C4583_19405 [Anaerolineaceae bacterium]|nr:MAG: hypothetical protein C4583_19405 [Anaerolineaceae bacterium]